MLNELQKEQPKEADLCLTVIINQLKAGQLDAAQAAVDVYLGNSLSVESILKQTPAFRQVRRVRAVSGQCPLQSAV